jgi:hypothetical protein
MSIALAHDSLVTGMAADILEQSNRMESPVSSYFTSPFPPSRALMRSVSLVSKHPLGRQGQLDGRLGGLHDPSAVSAP